jgi:hypothetical protein
MQTADATSGPVPILPGDPLPERDRLAREANSLAHRPAGSMTHFPETVIESIAWLAAEQSFRVKLTGASLDTIDVDRIVVNAGYRPNRQIHEELHVDECYVTGAPRKLAAALFNGGSLNDPGAISIDPQSLITPELDFYILGAKSFGRDGRFLLAHGLAQIRALFSIIGDRTDLDLYRTMSR